MDTMKRKSPALYDADEEANETPWAKALGRYRAKGMSEKEINLYRKDWQKGQGVKSLASNSKKK